VLVSCRVLHKPNENTIRESLPAARLIWDHRV
jgi:hypothetical protein